MKQVKIINNGLDAVKMFNEGYRKGIQKAIKEEIKFLEYILSSGDLGFTLADNIRQRLEKLNQEIK